MTGPEHGEHPLSEGDDEPWAEGPPPPGDSDESWVEGWDKGWGDEEGTEDDDAAPAWRRPLIVGVSVVTALALALIPLYNVIFARTVADNGLEVCGFDYCVVQEAVRDAGLDLTMSALANTYLDEEEARALAGELTDYLGIDPVGLRVVPDLDGRLGGVYDPSNRSIAIESPARAWTVLHEVAHAVETGHGEAFVDVVIELAAWLEKA
ncbi:MAG TPA: hypothetical protein VFT85_06445, partial [Acidimicrobiia bacterium]|nr:hypothetical protein [Acidimicrobiia bacterium]